MTAAQIKACAMVPREFYARDPRLVSPQLLGKLLVRKIENRWLAGRIVEVEAYLGAADAAAHSAAGPTKRNSVLFGLPGHAYVYFIYGMHYCLNISCMPEGDAGCVLVRALEPVAGLGAMAALRKTASAVSDGPPAKLLRSGRLLTSGPGRLCQALGIARSSDNGKDVSDEKSDLQILDSGFAVGEVESGPRVGISKASEAELRYWLAGNEFVSGMRKK